MNKNLFFGALLCLVMVSCSSSKKVTDAPKTVQMTEEQKLKYDHDFIDATKLKLFGNLPDAASLLTRCIDANPYDDAAYFQLAEIYGLIDDRENALKNARLAARYNTTNQWYKMQLANLYVLNKNTDSAIVVYEDMVRSQPENTDLNFNLAILYTESGDYKKALKQLNQVEKIYGFTEEIAIAQYRLYSKKNDAKATESLLLKSIDEFPDELRFYGLLAELYSSMGKEQLAQDNYKKLLEVDPENALGYISMIEFYKDYGNDEKAVEESQRMFQLKTIDPELKVELFLSLSSDTAFFRKHYQTLNLMIKQLYEMYPDNFRVRMVNADRNLREKNFEAAKDDLLFITDKIPTNYFLWEQLFYLLNLLQDNQALYEETGKALKFFEDKYLFHFFHGIASSLLKKYDEAILSYLATLEYLKKEKDSDKDVELQTYVMLGEAYNEKKRYQESDQVFELALALAPDNPLILNNYSYYLSLREEKLDLAEQYIKRCISQEPNSSTYLDTYGWVLYKLGRLNEAIEMVEKAMENGGNDNPEIVEHLCELLVVSGQSDEAYHVCKYAIELNNAQETVEQKIEQIKKPDKYNE